MTTVSQQNDSYR